jgi:putative transposase
MGWRESCVLDEKLRFIAEALKGDLPMTALCASFGISRQTGYELIRRYTAEGALGLEPRSRAPHHPGQGISAPIAAAIVALRGERPFWGPKKLRAVLQRREPGTVWPAPSSIGDLLRREGLSQPQSLPLRKPAPDVIRGRGAASDGGSVASAIRTGAGAKRAVVHRLQGLVPHARWRAL